MTYKRLGITITSDILNKSEFLSDIVTIFEKSMILSLLK
jgi:hypothetical protein